MSESEKLYKQLSTCNFETLEKALALLATRKLIVLNVTVANRLFDRSTHDFQEDSDSEI